MARFRPTVVVQRQAAWLRYAVAFCWSQWTTPFAVLLNTLVVVLIGTPSDASIERMAIEIGILLLVYEAWLQWFLARYGLGLRMGQAIGLTLAVGLMVLLPYTPILVAQLVTQFGASG